MSDQGPMWIQVPLNNMPHCRKHYLDMKFYSHAGKGSHKSIPFPNTLVEASGRQATVGENAFHGFQIWVVLSVRAGRGWWSAKFFSTFQSFT
jgi:hypothetical protein